MKPRNKEWENYAKKIEKKQQNVLSIRERLKDATRELLLSKVRSKKEGSEARRILNDRRVDHMFLMKKSGMTLEQIGLEYGVTRERVRQLIASMPGYVLHKCVRKPTSVNIKRICLNCFSYFWIKKHIDKNKKYCRPQCGYESMRGMHYIKKPRKEADKEDWRRYWNERTKWYYHNVFKKRTDFKQLIRKRNKLYQERKAKKLNK